MFSLLAYRGKSSPSRHSFLIWRKIWQIAEWNICPLSPPPHTHLASDRSNVRAQVFLTPNSLILQSWVSISVSVLCVQTESSSSLGAPCHVGGSLCLINQDRKFREANMAFTGPGMMSSFLNKTIEKFSTQKSKNISVQDCAAGSETHSGQSSCRCAIWTEVKFPGG